MVKSILLPISRIICNIIFYPVIFAFIPDYMIMKTGLPIKFGVYQMGFFRNNGFVGPDNG